MFEAYFVYTFLLILFVFCSCLKVNGSRKTAVYFAIIVASLVLGLRYGVGVDYMGYKYNFEHPDTMERLEFGYVFLNRLLFSSGLGFPSIFIVIAFCQLFFFYKGIEKYPKIVPYAFFFYFTTLYLFLSLNVMRQTLAFSLFVFSIHFVYEKKLVKYIITIFIAGLFHKSALILIPFYFILNKDLFYSRKLQYVLYFSTFIAGYILSDLLWQNFAMLAEWSGYGNYADNIEQYQEVGWGKGGAGLGDILWLIVDCGVIYYSTILKRNNTILPIVVFYNLYFIGVLLANSIGGSYLERVNIYFQNFRIIVYSVAVAYLIKYEKKVIINFAILGIFIAFLLFFYRAIANKASMCAPFEFVSF